MAGSAQGKRETMVGVVLSDKMDKTRVVGVTRTTSHPKYRRVVERSSKYKVHDEKNESKEGDTVRIMQTRPLSKEKHWRLVGILKKRKA